MHFHGWHLMRMQRTSVAAVVAIAGAYLWFSARLAGKASLAAGHRHGQHQMFYGSSGLRKRGFAG